MIELYIDNKRIELNDDVNINFTYQTIDTQNPSAVKNSFSKTVKIPGTLNNDEIFGNIWRFDSYITASNPGEYTGIYYDPHKRTPFMVMKNGALIENGYVVLDNIMANERDHYYNVTLFGGIGEFFFNLMYDDEGKEKNLSSLYWKWIPLQDWTTSDWESDPLTPEEEDIEPIYRLKSSNITYSWHRFDPNDTNPMTGKTFIGEDILFVPMYYGFANNFTSDKLLVNRQCVNDLPSDIQSQWDSTFPSSFVDGSDTYSLFSEGLDDIYGIIELPREIDAAEARDFRTINMPMAIKLSKLMSRISDPVNNGGYTVVWDSKITSSYWWKYGFILCDTPEYNTEEIVEDEFVFSNMTINCLTGQIQPAQVTGTSTSTITIGSTASPMIKFKPVINGQTDMHISQGVGNLATLSSNVNYNDTSKFVKSSKILCWLVQFYENDETLKGSELCGVTFSNTNDHFGSGYYMTSSSSSYPSAQSGWETKILNYINTRFSLSITNSNIHLLDGIGLASNGTEPGVWPSQGKIQYFRSNNFEFNIPVPKPIENMSIRITEFCIGYYFGYNGSSYSDAVYGFTSQDITDTNTFITNVAGSTIYTPGFYKIFCNKDTDSSTGVNYYACPGYVHVSGGGGGQHPAPVITTYFQSQTITTSYYVGLYDSSGEYGTYLDIYKSTLMNNTKSPYKYLIDFAKVLNLRFIYDKPTKKITILPLTRYFQNTTKSLTGKVDYSRGIKTTHLFNKNKFIKGQLKNNDTWPNTIYKKISKYDYGEYSLDTGIEFNKDSKNILDGLIYSNSMLYQQKSIYHNLSEFLPSPVGQSMVNWTLFNVDGDEIKSKTNSYPALDKKNTLDKLPKIGSFDKDNKTVKVDTTFVFFNGLVKNFDVVEVESGTTYVLSPRVMVTDNSEIQTVLAGAPCYYWGYKSDGTSTGFGENYKNASVSWYLPYFSRNLYMTYKSSNHTWSEQPSLLASWDLVKPENELYDESLIEFITNSNTQYNHTLSAEPTNFTNFTQYSNASSSYIMPNFWNDYLNDYYNRNSKEIEIYAKIEEDPLVAMRKFYTFENNLWIITKIENFNLDSFKDHYCKCTLHKVMNKNHYLWNEKLSWQEQQAIIQEQNEM